MTRVGAMVTATTTVLAACAGEKPAEPPAPPTWEARLGQSVTIEGIAEPRKLGAYVAGGREGLWIDGLQDWPAGVVGRRVRVTGRVIARADLPVFVQPPPGAPIPAGVPVTMGEPPKPPAQPLPPGTDLERAARRFLLADVQWKLLE